MQSWYIWKLLRQYRRHSQQAMYQTSKYNRICLFLLPLVSVKSWDVIGGGDMQKAMGDMKEYVQLYRPILCILMVVGPRKVSNPPRATGKFPENDAFVPVVVPEGKSGFCRNEAIQQSATFSVYGELLASHAFAHAEDQNYLAIRSRTTKEEQSFGVEMLDDKNMGE